MTSAQVVESSVTNNSFFFGTTLTRTITICELPKVENVTFPSLLMSRCGNLSQFEPRKFVPGNLKKSPIRKKRPAKISRYTVSILKQKRIGAYGLVLSSSHCTRNAQRIRFRETKPAPGFRRPEIIDRAKY